MAASLKAQTIVPGSFMDYNYRENIAHAMPTQNNGKKWSFSKYTALSASYSFFKGGSASVFAVPVGVQVNRQLTNTIYAFAGIAAAPAFISFNNAFLSSDVNKINPNSSFLHTNSFGMYSRAELGLMYVNPEKTFSISGSIGVERSSSPALFYAAPNIQSNNTVSRSSYK